MALLWIPAALIGLLAAIAASRGAIHHAIALLAGTRIPPFFIGVTLVAVGTDLPEIANSIVSSAAGHGDLNVGDSIGSTATQITLVLGLLPFFSGGFPINRRSVAVTGTITAICLAVGALLVADGRLDRLEAGVLLVLWLAGSWLAWRSRTPSDRTEPQAIERVRTKVLRGRAYHAFAAMFYLLLVGGGATLAIQGIVEIARWCAVPEYILSFLALSLGTSLPELVVDLTALRKGHGEIAIGDVFGSSMVDATLSIGIGPLLFPNVVDGELAVRGALVALVVVVAATAITTFRRRYNRWRGAFLLAAYLGIYPVLIA